jgi:hypothetical protein
MIHNTISVENKPARTHTHADTKSHSLPVEVFWLASVLTSAETRSEGWFPPYSLPKTPEDLKSATDNALSQNDNDPQFCKTFYSSVLERLQQKVIFSNIKMALTGM